MGRSVLRSSVISILVAASFTPVLMATAAGPTAPAASASATPSATPPPAASGSAATDAKRAEAINHFNRGVELMQGEAWDAALVEFNASIALLPTKNATKNAAVCMKELHRFDEALAGYESLMANFAAKLTPQEVESVKKAIEDLKALTGYLSIKSNVDGANVVIDGKDRGKTPIAQPILVASGTHLVRVSKEGYLPFEVNQAVVGKSSQTIEANLEALARSGRLKVVESSGKVLDVLVDGAVVGKTPYEGPLSPGAHSVVLKGEGRLGTQPAAANIVVDQTFVLRATAEELKADAHIDPDPVSATVILDGVAVGSGGWDGAVRVGNHKVDVSAEGYFASTKSFEATEGKKSEVKVTLERDENSPFWSAGRRFPISLGVFGSFAIGKSLGGDYETSCGGTAQCDAHSLPTGILGGVRGAYELPSGLAFELELGYARFAGKVTRTTSLLGEGGPVPVNITDEFSLSGLMIGVGASYTFFRLPVAFSGALGGGIILGKARETRNGTATAVDAEPHVRPLTASTADPISKTIPYFKPEVRVALPIGKRFQVGIAIGAIIGVADIHPFVRGSVLPSANDGKVNSSGQFVPGNPTSGGQFIGFVGPKNNESAFGTFVLPEGSLFARFSF